MERKNKRQGTKTQDTKGPLEVTKASTTASGEESILNRNKDSDSNIIRNRFSAHNTHTLSLYLLQLQWYPIPFQARPLTQDTYTGYSPLEHTSSLMSQSLPFIYFKSFLGFLNHSESEIPINMPALTSDARSFLSLLCFSLQYSI